MKLIIQPYLKPGLYVCGSLNQRTLYITVHNTAGQGTLFSLFGGQQSPVGHSLIIEVSRTHTTTHHSR